MRKTFNTLAVTVFLACVLFSTPANAKVTEFLNFNPPNSPLVNDCNYSGYVIDTETDLGLSGATVTIKERLLTESYQTTTDGDGYWSISFAYTMPGNRYSVSAAKDGYLILTTEGYSAFGVFCGTYQLNFFATPIE